MKKLNVISLVLGAVAIVLAALCLFNILRDRKLPGFKADTELYVRPQDKPSDIYLVLAQASRWPSRLGKVMAREGALDSICPGHYAVPASATATYCSRMLAHGWQTPVRLTISENIRLKSELAKRISSQMMMDSAAVMRSFSDDTLLCAFGANSENVFSLFLPDTYEVYWTEGMEEILARQKKVNDAFWTPERLRKAADLGLSRAEVTVLASIVDAETNDKGEMRKIAGVYLNRLKRGMRLQADPTIAYCYGYTMNRILKTHLKVDSPYNTYTHVGLPPAPIRIASRSALEAVLDADCSGGILYFCADPSFNGTHRFTKSYSVHLRNAREFQKALNRLQIK